MELIKLVQEAHRKYDKLTIETNLIQNPGGEDEWSGIKAEVTTPKGLFTSWVIGDITNLTECEDKAITLALIRAGIEIQPDYFVTKTERIIEPVILPVAVFQSFDDGEDIVTEEAVNILCADCGNMISEYYSGSTRMDAATVAKKTEERHSRPLCTDCSIKQIGKKRKAGKTKQSE